VTIYQAKATSFFSQFQTLLLCSFLVNDELLKTGDFDMMSKSTDENEHSIELHLPYIAKVMER